MERLFWIILVIPECYHSCPCKRNAEGDFMHTHTDTDTHTHTRRSCKNGSKECCDYKPKNASIHWKLEEARNGFYSRIHREYDPVDTLILDQ